MSYAGPSTRIGERAKPKTYLIAFIDDTSRVIPYAAFALAPRIRAPSCRCPKQAPALRSARGRPACRHAPTIIPHTAPVPGMRQTRRDLATDPSLQNPRQRQNRTLIQDNTRAVRNSILLTIDFVCAGRRFIASPRGSCIPDPSPAASLEINAWVHHRVYEITEQIHYEPQ
uniref:Uncharacterized protein n=1 Tax=Candidatus Kentrum sp. SD TaxID=2126332 RepID=A0A450YAX2_9GAMM|nr:MAG: hypothetical protein BECKSD772F_GA0070984_100185 [Candidatus Kentron sp. SD]VFK38696.1 MAG: hypothetical protein BECKSD772E_GA0070983_100184 [Candidatus Kentron sp. SD]